MEEWQKNNNKNNNSDHVIVHWRRKITSFVNKVSGFKILNHLQGIYYGIVVSLAYDSFYQSFVYWYLQLWMVVVMHIWDH